MATDAAAAVLEANRAFYAAFAAGDVAAMARLWADRVPVTCIHPGWPPLHGRSQVLASWRAILSRPPSSATAEDEQVVIHDGTALVLCRAQIGNQSLATTNVFLRTGDGWRLVHHQSGALARPAQPPASRMH